LDTLSASSRIGAALVPGRRCFPQSPSRRRQDDHDWRWWSGHTNRPDELDAFLVGLS